MGRFSDTLGSVAEISQLRPGDTRTIAVKDATGQAVKTLTLHRTSREYVHDLCDAYNDGMDEGARRQGMMWEVLPSGEMKLGFPRQFSDGLTDKLKRDRESERQRWLRNHRGDGGTKI